MGWTDVRDGKGHLLFRYDPQRQLIEVHQRGVRSVIDLTQYQSTATSGRQNAVERPSELKDGSTWDKEAFAQRAH